MKHPSDNKLSSLGEVLRDLMFVSDILNTDIDFTASDLQAVYARHDLERVCRLLAGIDYFVIIWLSQTHRSIPKLWMNSMNTLGESIENALSEQGGTLVAVPNKIALGLHLWVGHAFHTLQSNFPAAGMDAARRYLEYRLSVLEQTLWSSVFDLEPISLLGVTGTFLNVRAIGGDEPQLWAQSASTNRLVPLKELTIDNRQDILRFLADKFQLSVRLE